MLVPFFKKLFGFGKRAEPDLVQEIDEQPPKALGYQVTDEELRRVDFPPPIPTQINVPAISASAATALANAVASASARIDASVFTQDGSLPPAPPSEIMAPGEDIGATIKKLSQEIAPEGMANLLSSEADDNGWISVNIPEISFPIEIRQTQSYMEVSDSHLHNDPWEVKIDGKILHGRYSSKWFAQEAAIAEAHEYNKLLKSTARY